MKLLDDYLELEKKMHEYFGYGEYCSDFIISDFIIDDSRDYFWHIITKNSVGEVRYTEKEEDLFSGKDDYYCHELCGYIKFNNGVYRGKDFTMVTVYSDEGDKFLMIFDNKKEFKASTT